MSDTPRTDALVGDFPFPWSYHMEMTVRHAEQLERELTAAKLELEDKRFCKDGLWYCSTGERLSRELDALKATASGKVRNGETPPLADTATPSPDATK